MLQKIQAKLNQLLELDTVSTAGHCPSDTDVDACRKTLDLLEEELAYVRNATIFIKNVTVEMGATWQYRQSTFNQTYSTVTIVNKGMIIIIINFNNNIHMYHYNINILCVLPYL